MVSSNINRIAFFIVIVASLSCSSESPAETRRRLDKLPADSKTEVEFQGKRLSRSAYEEKTRQHALAFQASLKKRFRVDFEVRRFKYFALACRCNKQHKDSLQYFTEQFFKDIYPRYFKYEPRQIFKIVYFKDRREMTNLTGHSSYGYYTYKDRTFYTYIGSGHGTLWHELMHAFMHAEYPPGRPQWFEEGLASFYEMAMLDNRGRVIEGYANWRLPAMQRRIYDGNIRSLKDALQNRNFDAYFGYAEARWFFVYLWMHGQLDRFVVYYLQKIQQIKDPHLRHQAVISYLQSILKMDWSRIESGYKASALKARKNQKLKQFKRRG